MFVSIHVTFCIFGFRYQSSNIRLCASIFSNNEPTDVLIIHQGFIREKMMIPPTILILHFQNIEI
nr:hypothetical protein [uncultured bacterium]